MESGLIEETLLLCLHAELIEIRKTLWAWRIKELQIWAQKKVGECLHRSVWTFYPKWTMRLFSHWTFYYLWKQMRVCMKISNLCFIRKKWSHYDFWISQNFDGSSLFSQDSDWFLRFLWTCIDFLHCTFEFWSSSH